MKVWITKVLVVQVGFWGLLGAYPFCIAAAAAERIEDQKLEARPGDTLLIENDYGRVRVTAWDQPGLEVQIRKIAVEETNLQKIYVLSHRAGNKIFLRAFFYEYQSESLYLDIRAPSYLNVVVWGVNPAVEVEGLDGKVNVHTITGFITARNLLLASSLASDEGNIQYFLARQPSEDIHLESLRGNINCTIAGSLNLRSWLRAGNTLSWNSELTLRQGSLEKQIGIGGPLILAASSEGNVSISLNETAEPAGKDPKDLEHVQTSQPPIAAETIEPQAVSYPQSIPDTDPESVPTVSGYSLKVNVDWIYVNASVRDRHTNRAVPDLIKDDFEIYEEGTPQEIEQFESTEAPFSLLLLLDVSGSTKSYINMVKDASIQFTQEIKTNDQVAVATFNSRTRLVHDFTNDRGSIRSAIGRIHPGGGTAFYDALDRSVRDYMDDIEGRKAIVVFTDGVDNQLTGDFGSGSRTTFNDLYREIQEADILIYTIFLDTEGQQGGRRGLGGILGDIIFKGPTIGIPGGGGWGQDQAYAQARRELELIADQTGGRMYSPKATRDLVHVYSEIANDLRVQYTLGYPSVNAASSDEWREIEVKIVNRPDLAVRARRGYYGSKG